MLTSGLGCCSVEGTLRTSISTLEKSLRFSGETEKPLTASLSIMLPCFTCVEKDESSLA